jgi:hypothetical protein
VEAFLPDNDTNAEKAEYDNTNDDPDDDTSVFEGELSELSGGLSLEANFESAGSLEFSGVGPDDIDPVSSWDNDLVGLTN